MYVTRVVLDPLGDFDGCFGAGEFLMFSLVEKPPSASFHAHSGVTRNAVSRAAQLQL